ncbi:MAG: hypothetical protein GY795_22475, partial [Desulfobacterales bacterium]|nr:hypothetical protein [Desulfobacterales bacterium]
KLGDSPLKGGQGGVFRAHDRLSECEQHPPGPPQGGNIQWFPQAVDTPRSEVFTKKTSEVLETSEVCSLTFEVEDTGPGIAPDELDILFDAFTQTETGRKSQEGTGLGLPISRNFVQMMGGDITVESEVGRGSIFRFWIQAEVTAGAALESAQLKRSVIALEAAEAEYTPDQERDALTADALAALPADWVVNMEQAILNIDLDQMSGIIGQISERDALLADMLGKYVDDFEYEKILRLIQGVQDE